MLRTSFHAITLSVFALTAAAHAAALQVAKDKVALAAIVVPDDAVAAERFAAQELSDYLQRISGAGLAIVHEAAATNGNQFLIGRTRAGQPILAELQGMDADGFAVRRVNNSIVLAGNTPRATLYAVYDLLERELGCRWLAPGKAWEEVPTKKRVTLAIKDRVERPGMKYRYERMTYLPASGDWQKEALTWAVRQRINIGYEWPGSAEAAKTFAPYGEFRGFMWPHSLGHLTDIKQLHREHPEWFALVKGSRPLDAEKNVNLCTSNPEVIAFMAKLLAESFALQPQAEFLPLGPGDGTGFCQCERCRALDTGGSWSYTDGIALPALGDRWLTFVNGVADKLAVTNPEKKIYTIAYHQTFAPPLKNRPRPNVMVMVVNSRPEGVCFVHPVATPDCPNNALFCRNFKGWSAITSAGMMTYQYMPHSTFCLMPLPAPEKFITDIRWLSKHGCVGYEGQSGYTLFGLFGITLYATAKAMWNPQIDADALLKDYCDSAFHEASKPMQTFFRAFARGQKEAAHTHTGIWTALTPAVLKQARDAMDKAQAAARDQTVKRRLASLDAHLQYAEDGCSSYHLAESAVKKRDLNLLLEATALAREAERKLAAAQKADPECLNLTASTGQLDRIFKGARSAINVPTNDR